MAGRNYLLNCEILHEIRGRIRIRSRALKYLGVHKEEITKRLMQVHYIKSVEISTITGSVLIYFDNFSLTGENFVSLLQNTLNGYLVDIYKNEKKQASNKYVIERRLQEESPKEIMKNKVISSIGPVTTKTIEKYGLKIGIEGKKFIVERGKVIAE